MAPLSTPHLMPTPQPQMFPTLAHLQTPLALEKQQMERAFLLGHMDARCMGWFLTPCIRLGATSRSTPFPVSTALQSHQMQLSHVCPSGTPLTVPTPLLVCRNGLTPGGQGVRSEGTLNAGGGCSVALVGLVRGTGVDAFAGRREKYHLPVGFGKTISENFLALCGK